MASCDPASAVRGRFHVLSSARESSQVSVVERTVVKKQVFAWKPARHMVLNWAPSPLLLLVWLCPGSLEAADLVVRCQDKVGS